MFFCGKGSVFFQKTKRLTKFMIFYDLKIDVKKYFPPIIFYHIFCVPLS
jgi:hypothetical protein